MSSHEDFLRDALGFSSDAGYADPSARREQVNLELLVHGLTPAANGHSGESPAVSGKLVESFRERMRLQFRAELFNAWNHTQFQQFANAINTPAFGTWNDTEPPGSIVSTGW